MTDTIAAAADFLVQSHARREPYRSVAGEIPIAGLDQAYDVQDAFVARRLASGAGAPWGYKIALTSKAMQEMCGVDRPLAGVVFSSVVRQGPARLALSDFQHVGVEFELAVQLAGTLVPGGAAWTGETVADHVAACLPALELVEDRHCDYGNLEALGLIADNAWNGGVILGEATGDWRALDLANTPVALFWTGTDEERSNTSAALGHPFNAVAWIANHLNARGKALQAGEWVMTGSTMRTRFPEGGEEVRYTIDGLGSVEMTVA